MTSHYLQPSFSGGEISPSLQARTDASSYHTWLHTAQNMVIHSQGGISNRLGTQYMATAKSAAVCRLIPFPLSSDEAYVIEAGAQYFRFHTAGGPVLNGQGNVLEIATPYAQEDLTRLHYAQYQAELYVSHPKYPPYKLTRTAPGVFAWEKVPLKGGPFQPLNMDETYQMRVYPQTETLESTGVAAHLTLEPVNDSQSMVWAYFDGIRFYMSETFGLNIPAIVSAFNTAYGSQGLTAYNLGSMIRIESSAQDGGDWNGKIFSIEYHHGFIDPAQTVFSQKLIGGENAGVSTEVATGHYVLESNTAYFTPSQVEGLFCLIHAVDAQYQSGSLGYESTSAIVSCGEGWTLRTSGTWTGQLVVETSRDLGATWQTHKILSRTAGDDNFYLSGNTNDAENMYQVRVRSVQITGEAGYELTSDAFSQRGILKVIGYVSETQLIVSCEQAFGSQDWTSCWAEGSFSPAAGYPACVFFYHNRLGLAATSAEPQTLWFSKSGNFADFGRARDTLLDTDALSVCLSSQRLNAVQSVVVSNRLLIFTTGSEWTLTCNGSFTLDHLQLEQQSQRGAYATLPVMVGGRALFVQARGSALRDFYYDYSQASYVGEELTWRAKHLFAGRTIVEMAFQQEPDSLLWCILDDGSIRSLTYVPEQGFAAWTQHITAGTPCSICSIAQEGKDQIWWVVQRNGKYLIERFCPRAEQTDVSSNFFLDASVSCTFTQAQHEITGLSYIEGQTVSALADGNVVEGLVVSGGKITLPIAAKQVYVGLAYTSQLMTLPVPAGTLGGVKKQRLVSVCVHLLNSRGGKIGTQTSTLTELCQRTDEAYNEAIRLQNGPVQVSLSDIHQPQSGVRIVQDEPLPLTVLAVNIQFS